MINHFYEFIDGWFSFRAIYEEALNEAADGAKFVEVGSWYGRSAAWMAVEIANSGKQVEFYCVDTWRGSVDTPWMAQHLAPIGGSAKPKFLENIERGGVSKYVRSKCRRSKRPDYSPMIRLILSSSMGPTTTPTCGQTCAHAA